MKALAPHLPSALLAFAALFCAAGLACAVLHIGTLAVILPLLVLAVVAFIAAMGGLAACWRSNGVPNREIALRIAAFIVFAALVIVVAAYVGNAKAMIGAVSPALHHGGVHVLPSVLYVVLIGILGIVFGALCFAMRREVEPLAVDIDGIVTHAVSVAVTDVRRAFDAEEARYRAALAAALARAHRHEAVIAAPSPSPIARETAPITRTADAPAQSNVGARPAPLSRPLGGSQSPHEESHMESFEAAAPTQTKASLSVATILGGFADFVVNEMDGNKALIESEIGKGETSAEALAEDGLNSLLSHAGGPLGFIAPLIAGSVKSYAQELVSKFGPAVIFTLAEAQARRIAVQLGG